MTEPETLTGPSLSLTLGSLTLGGILTGQCAQSPDRDALVFDDPLVDDETVRWTYTGLLAQSRRVAKALLAIGVSKGARVGILMGNRPEAVMSILGATLVGAVATPLSTFSARPELGYLLEHADISVLLTQTKMGKRRFVTDVRKLCPTTADAAPIADPAFPYLRHVAVVGSPADCKDLTGWDSFLDNGEAISDALLDAVIAQVHPSDPAVIIYSSGTTDRPKGVLHTHDAVARQWWNQAHLFRRDEFTRLWSPLPLFWTAGLNAAMGATLAGGATWIMQEMFDADDALVLIERERVTEPHVFAHQARALEEHPNWATADLSSCTEVFGKSVFTRHPTVTGDRSWNMPIGYGMSETASFLTGLPWMTNRDVLRNGSYGKLLPGNELRVIDPASGNVLGVGEEGEFIVRGPTLMEHYVKRTRAESFDPDGWYHTGDFGHFDEDGFVYFDGRRTEMIKTSGANVSPAEIEVQLQAFEAIKLARVIGIPDERRDEIVVLCVTLKDGAKATEAEIKTFLGDRVASYKVPKQVLFFADDEIPMNRTGTKVLTDELRVLVLKRLKKKR